MKSSPIRIKALAIVTAFLGQEKAESFRVKLLSILPVQIFLFHREHFLITVILHTRSLGFYPFHDLLFFPGIYCHQIHIRYICIIHVVIHRGAYNKNIIYTACKKYRRNGNKQKQNQIDTLSMH